MVKMRLKSKYLFTEGFPYQFYYFHMSRHKQFSITRTYSVLNTVGNILGELETKYNKLTEYCH